ncbi:nucleoside hydrolase [Agreia pratensis]|uniref:nucleoside hydrolase n=1 Tax=Microbacteriaceae TaxID=85023 RepID=UPI00188D8703|nr:MULTISPECIES: nucleoside hydrolase [Microbacteriaceae]MBF4561228.1 nucleoside hydrolase [Microbacterium sp. VKM Ac-2870]MBF4633883.1 nucleoside hydrolase [Agreia pratensis]
MSASSPRRVLLDADTGLDDALALAYLTAVPELELLAVTGVDGCVDGIRAAHNSAMVLQALGHPEVPIGAATGQYDGIATPPPVQAFGPSGMGEVVVGPPDEARSFPDSVELMARILDRDRLPTTLLCTGPLTNAAKLLRDHPGAARWIDRIFVMGGSIAAGGNVTAAAEFNILRDPEAADAVFLADIPTTLYGLDVFVQPVISTDELGTRPDDSPRARLSHLLLRELAALFPGRGAFLGDGGAAVVLMNPELASKTSYPARVELEGTHTRGATVVDRRDSQGGDWPRIDFVTAVDPDGIVSEFLRQINRKEAP